MSGWLSQRSGARRSAHDLYGSSVAQARSAAFYRDLSVPDTAEGRLEMIMLHVFLVSYRLEREGREGADLARRVQELMFSEIDGALREIGVGDLTVPKTMHKTASAFYGRMKAYAEGLAAGTDSQALTRAIVRNVPGAHVQRFAPRIARYVAAANLSLQGQSLAALRGGQVRFPAIEEVP